MTIVKARAFAGGLFRGVRHPYLRGLPALAFGIWFVWLLSQRLQDIDLELLTLAVRAIPLSNWLGAMIAVAVSFLAISHYDVIAARSLGFTIREGDVMRAGFVATALAQLLGLGLATGSLARWRMLRGDRLTLWQATKLTTSVTLGFLASAFAILAILISVSDVFGTATRLVASAGLCLLAAAFVIAIFRPKIRICGHVLEYPPIKVMAGFLLLSAIDLLAAGLCFWLLMPGDGTQEFAAVLAVIALASLAGLISGMPGGIGPFEIVCLMMMPAADQTALLAAIVGYRMVYYVVPGIIAMLHLLWREGSRPMRGTSHTAPTPNLRALIDGADRAEARLFQTCEFEMIPANDRSGCLMAKAAGNSLICLSDPLAPSSSWAGLFTNFKRSARRQNLFPVIYKCSKDVACRASDAGFQVHQIGVEAVLNPREFSCNGPEMRGLRRKLQQAKRGGVSVVSVSESTLPLADMKDVATEWSRRQNGERRFSMGCFSPDRTHLHRHFLAYSNGHLVGFIGVWQTKGELALDLIRTADAAPNGTLYALVVAAIQEAKTNDVSRFSLSSVPFAGLENGTSFPERLCFWTYRARPDWHGAQGLYQFKDSFRPDWEPRYLAVTGLFAAGLAALDLAALIRPEPKMRRPQRLSNYLKTRAKIVSTCLV